MCLEESARALFTERVYPLAGEAYEQAVLVFVLLDVLDDVANRLGDRKPFDGGLPAQLLRHGALILQIADHHVH